MKSALSRVLECFWNRCCSKRCNAWSWQFKSIQFNSIQFTRLNTWGQLNRIDVSSTTVCFHLRSSTTLHVTTGAKFIQRFDCKTNRRFSWSLTNGSDFNLSGGCFGTEIIKNCTKWSNIGVHGLSIGPIEAEFQGASFLIRKNAEKW